MDRNVTVRTAVLIGAGGSAFANMPTVLNFFGNCEWTAGQAPRHKDLCIELARLISLFEGNRENDVWPQYDAEKLFGYLELLERASKLEGKYGFFGNPNFPPGSTDELMKFLRREIVKTYGRRVDLAGVVPHKALCQTLDELHPPRDPIPVFTTNYDVILENALSDKHVGPLPSGKRVGLCTGFAGNYPEPQIWNAKLFDVPPADGERLFQLVKLHGSTTWKKDGDELIDLRWGKPTEFDSLLYFGYKSVPEDDTYITLHAVLKKALLESDAFVVIGFRFGDPYIKDLFDFALRANKRLRIICCLTGMPADGSPIEKMMKVFPGRVNILLDAYGKAVRFGGEGFESILRDTLTNSIGATAIA